MDDNRDEDVAPESALDDAEVAADVEETIVVAVTDDTDPAAGLDEEALADIVEEHRAELDHTLADLQQELAGMAKTGIPGVDEALDQLGALDPNDLQGSSELLAEVLAKLESVMSETPQE